MTSGLPSPVKSAATAVWQGNPEAITCRFQSAAPEPRGNVRASTAMDHVVRAVMLFVLSEPDGALVERPSPNEYLAIRNGEPVISRPGSGLAVQWQLRGDAANRRDSGPR